jgi:hypothetical protein
MLSSLRSIGDRVIGGMRRRILAAPGIHPLAMRVRDAARERHTRTLIPAPPHLQRVLRDLETTGISVATRQEAGALGSGIPDVTALFAELEQVATAATSRRKASALRTATPYVAGLHPALLDIAEHYIGLPPLYLGVEAKVEFPTGSATGVRNWHRDLEDVRLLKVLIYLSDVDEEDGPLEYLSREESRELVRQRVPLGIGSAWQPRMAATRAIVGPAGTAIFFDGSILVHRAKPPTRRMRRSLMYSYTSDRPRQIFAGARPSAAVRDQLPSLLSDRQMRCVP